MKDIYYCQECNKKLKLIASIIGKCKCGNYYCDEHKLNGHNCVYDYKNDRDKKIVKIETKIMKI